ncbi:MAG: UDP-N-acetylmuramate:L-alanyl-gamma-D-glutamyl-meso-diaminopimelate ligase [Rhodanobacteraceae bacterium]|nr:UDP-N-acetylmuramate:L-alanyl-gamma-D-glutamyl-meso-diaminopimelate ligase [Rhodanobacteraceae bacterium]
MNTDLHILGICGTFMGGIAAIARESGMKVSGSDRDVYPPMSTQLEALGIQLHEGYSAEHLPPPPAEIAVGNALSRGNAAVESVLDRRLEYTSGPEWLARRVLHRRRVLAVAGTHGKTTTSALLAFLLDRQGRDPGFLIGGVPHDFPVSARLGAGDDFVIEADEYDTAFFDKRSKFVHYRPTVAILNNLEYDHADIFPDLAAIQRQFHHLVRTVPGNGRLIVNGEDASLAQVLEMGCWTPVERFGLDSAEFDWRGELLSDDGSHFRLWNHGSLIGETRWKLLGRHNVANAVGAIAAAAAIGLNPAHSLELLGAFGSVRRRLESVGEIHGIRIYDDFAHHPTAIATTLEGLRAAIGNARLIAVMEPRSNSMRQGAHALALPKAFIPADRVHVLARPELGWDAARTLAPVGARLAIAASVPELLDAVAREARSGDHIIFMSNGGFEGASRRLLAQLSELPCGSPA